MKTRISLIYWVILIIWLALAVFLSRQTGEETASLSGTIAEKLCAVLQRIGFSVKQNAVHSFIRSMAHIVVYLVLGFLLYRTFRLSFRGGWVMAAALLLCLLFGVLDECQKAFIPGRHLHWRDVAFNCVSGAAGVLAGWLTAGK